MRNENFCDVETSKANVLKKVFLGHVHLTLILKGTWYVSFLYNITQLTVARLCIQLQNTLQEVE